MVYIRGIKIANTESLLYTRPHDNPLSRHSLFIPSNTLSYMLLLSLFSS